MRIYQDPYELMSEIMREVHEMGEIVHPKSMQNKDVSNDENFVTKEIINYSYCLKSIDPITPLFMFGSPKNWADVEFIERINGKMSNPGMAWLIREDVWKEFLNDRRGFDYTYGERISIFPELIIKELRRNPDSRQCILSIWDRTKDLRFIGGKKRVPCSIYYQFLIRNGKLHIIYNQRSADAVTHFGNDVYLAWQMKEFIAEQVGVKGGDLFHNIASLHSYKKDWETLKNGISKL